MMLIFQQEHHYSISKSGEKCCTVSPILFIMGMKIIMKAADGTEWIFWIYQPANREFMDDLPVINMSYMYAIWVLVAPDSAS